MHFRVLYILLMVLCLSTLALRAQTNRVDSVEINFKVSRWDLDPTIGSNRAGLDTIESRFTTIYRDSVYALRHVSIIGGASPEGSVKFNEFLSKQRADTLFNYLNKYRSLDAADKDFSYLGRNWEGVLALVRLDDAVPYRAETITLLESIVNEKRLSGREPEGSLERIKSLRRGVPYDYLLANIFPKVRASKVKLFYDKVLMPPVDDSLRRLPEADSVVTVVAVEDTVEAVAAPPRKPFYMDVRTNMLYDVLAIPNIHGSFI